MTNHVHLLATPRNAHGLPRMMQSLGRRNSGVALDHVPKMLQAGCVLATTTSAWD